MGVQPHLLFSLGGHSKQAGDERDLPSDIFFVHSLHLSFPKHVHGLISRHGFAMRSQRKRSLSRA